MLGPNGKIVINMTWQQFQEYQRWDEFPERVDNPPFTADMVFWYGEKRYIIAGIDAGVAIFEYDEYRMLVYDDNFLVMLQKPFGGKNSFKDLIEEILFED